MLSNDDGDGDGDVVDDFSGEPAPANLGNGLWLGSDPHAKTRSWLSAAGIGLVIDCRGEDAEDAMEAIGNPCLAPPVVVAGSR